VTRPHFPPLNSPQPRSPRRKSRITRLVTLGITASVMLFAVACGDGGSTALPLSPAAEEGRRIYVSSGCAGCHGRAGEGGVGPQLAGISGTERPLLDGRIVIADDDYLVRSIMDPNAEIVDGYSLRMPSNRLSEAEVQSVITFMKELEPRP
jgi:cytochrome c553